MLKFKRMCGIGAIYNRNGISIDTCQQMLLQLSHRGAHADGSGILVEIPWHLYQDTKKYKAVAQTFISSASAIPKITQHFENLNLKVQTRQVPTNNNIKNHPNIVQFIVSSSTKFSPYLLRNEIESKFNDCYVCSFHEKTIVYKALCAPADLFSFYCDFKTIKTRYAIVHARFSTNTNPHWNLCQPLRNLAHNGEINTLSGNIRNMNTKMSLLKLNNEFVPFLPFPKSSDSAAFDMVLDYYLNQTEWSLEELMLMMVPKAWEQLPDSNLKNMYHYFATIMEGWEGPASLLSTNGGKLVCSVDKCGLRPCRYMIASDGTIVLGSEFMDLNGLKFIDHQRIAPGEMISIDIDTALINSYPSITNEIINKYPFGKWTETSDNLTISLNDSVHQHHSEDLLTNIDNNRMLTIFNYTDEEIQMILKPMNTGKEALGSMGTDTAIASLSANPRLLFDYFHQLFAQVSNPAIDPIRESIMTSLSCPLGILSEMNPNNNNKWITVDSPIKSTGELKILLDHYVQLSICNILTIKSFLDANEYDIKSYLDHISKVVIDGNFDFIHISDKSIENKHVPVPILLLTSAIDMALTDAGIRRNTIVIVSTAEARQVHHMACLLAYGADIICPWFAQQLIMSKDNSCVDSISNMAKNTFTPSSSSNIPTTRNLSGYVNHYFRALNSGLLKIFAKMGISTLKSYKGSQLMETIGFSDDLAMYFKYTTNTMTGVTLRKIQSDYLNFYDNRTAGIGSHYHYRYNGEDHVNDPSSIAFLQKSVQINDFNEYLKYSSKTDAILDKCTIRGLLKYKKRDPIDVKLVEPWTEIVKRFNTGAMSFGSISIEAHTTLARAMNTMDTKSNSGEGGELPSRFNTLEQSKIKQIASGRFGVDSYYLSTADMIQIKIAQGAKPGQGGELPGNKVDVNIAMTRKTMPNIGLISPTNQHDIYSIEDLQQLIYDLKCCNPNALISVKLTSQKNIGTVCNGVVKGLANHIVISGYDGGTGAASWSSIKQCGIPFELGLIDAHSALINAGLRNNVVLQVDGNIRTANDVIKSCLLGAQEWGFSTVPLIAIGCIMMRKCHLNTCPVGIATQDPVLRSKFKGQPEQIINYFHFLAEEMRTKMAELGFRTVSEMIGQSHVLELADAGLQFDSEFKDEPVSDILFAPSVTSFDAQHLELVKNTISKNESVTIHSKIRNSDRSVGAYWSWLINRQAHSKLSFTGNITLNCSGYAGQSFGAFLESKITLVINGACNDYVGKGLSGGLIVVRSKNSNSLICGNVCLYGATKGYLFVNGLVGERFAIRNSGANSVVEGLSDHGLEYMTGGTVVCLGKLGNNIASGMTGGVAYLLKDKLKQSIKNQELTAKDRQELSTLLNMHVEHTGSELGKYYINHLDDFIKLDPSGSISRNVSRSISSSNVALSNSIDSGIADMEDLRISCTSVKDAFKRPLTRKKVDSAITSVASSNVSVSPDHLPFINIPVQRDIKVDAKHRVLNYNEITSRLPSNKVLQQASRCMDCGTPFCQSDYGCPIGNLIPQWNQHIANNDWYSAYKSLILTNNFPEFTGRACPAPCRDACVLNIISDPVSIKSIECSIIDKAFEMNWVQQDSNNIIQNRIVNKYKIGIVGSGPCGLAAADLLNQQGYTVHVHERSMEVGGLLMYGIPEMKIQSSVINRRVELLKKQGIKFFCNSHITDLESFKVQFDAVILATGALLPNSLQDVDENCTGFYYAMDYLTQSQMAHKGIHVSDPINCEGKHVIIVGAGDTATDCCATAYRQLAKSVDILDINQIKPSKPTTVWPELSNELKLDYGHEEGLVIHQKDPRIYGRQLDSVILNEKKEIKSVMMYRVESTKNPDGSRSTKRLHKIPEEIPCDILIAAIGFRGTHKLDNIEMTARQTIKTENYKTSDPKIFAAGDCNKGQSLIVWAIREGREVARQVDLRFNGASEIPLIGGIAK
eukprot:NODE_44_length_28780_cov_0.148496.p1 type:complete len:1939 gc:universal NODE_44_length_28780_cov_0.148496:9324-15140(+)